MICNIKRDKKLFNINNFATNVFYITKGKVNLFDDLMQLQNDYEKDDILGFQEFEKYLRLKYKKKFRLYDIIKSDDDDDSENKTVSAQSKGSSYLSEFDDFNEGSEKSKVSSIKFKDSSRIKYKSTAIAQYDIETEYVEISFINLEEFVVQDEELF